MSIGPRQFNAFVEQVLAEWRSLQELVGALRNGNEASADAQRQISTQLADLRIPHDEKVANNAHRDKAHRQQVILTWVTGCAFVAAAVYAAIAAYQLGEMRNSNEIARHQVTEAQNNLDTSMSQFDRTMHQMIAQTAAALDSSKAARRAADTAEKQRKILLEQMDQTERQVSANLVFNNFKVDSSNGKVLVSFDLVNVGGSAATQINQFDQIGGINSFSDAYRHIPGPTPIGFTCDKGICRHYEEDATEWSTEIKQRPPRRWSYTVQVGYLTVFQKAKGTCIWVIASSHGPQISTCPEASISSEKH